MSERTERRGRAWRRGAVFAAGPRRVVQPALQKQCRAGGGRSTARRACAHVNETSARCARRRRGVSTQRATSRGTPPCNARLREGWAVDGTKKRDEQPQGV